MRVPCAASTLDWMVMVVPVPQSHEFAAILPVPLAMVVVTDPEAEHVPNEVYRAMFSLTATEASLLAALVHGVSVNEWSAQRQISCSHRADTSCIRYSRRPGQIRKGI